MRLLLRSLSKALVFTVLLLLAGCYSKEFDEPGVRDTPTYNTQRLYRASYNSAWETTLQALEDFPVVTAKKESGYILTDWIIGKSDRLYSGYGDTKIPYKIRYKLAIRLQPSKKGTLISITNREQYYTDAITAGSEFSGSLYQWVDTKSSSSKENSILDSIETIISKNQK